MGFSVGFRRGTMVSDGLSQEPNSQAPLLSITLDDRAGDTLGHMRGLGSWSAEGQRGQDLVTSTRDGIGFQVSVNGWRLQSNSWLWLPLLPGKGPAQEVSLFSLGMVPLLCFQPRQQRSPTLGLPRSECLAKPWSLKATLGAPGPVHRLSPTS